MNRTRLIELLSRPEKLDEDTLDDLKEILATYPFFQAGRMLWIKNLHKLDHIRYNSELKLAAAYVPDRSRLFFLINDMFSPLSGTSEVREQEKNNDSAETGDPEVASHGQEKKEGLTGKEPEQEAEEDPETNENADRKTGYEANYFEVDDAVPSSTGELIDFSVSRKPDEDKDTSVSPGHNEESVLPSADLLDYEKEAYASSYSLEQQTSPASVDFNKSRSFSEWLSLLRQMPADQGKKSNQDEPEEQAGMASETPKEESSGKMDLIDSFLNNGGDQKRIVPSENEEPEETPNHDIAARFTEENEDLMTETLADIHIQQQRYHKAIEIFERLRLKYPEKSVYFARHIEEMEELINNQ